VPLAERGAAEGAPRAERVSVPGLRPEAAAVWAGAGLRREAAVWVGVVPRREALDAAGARPAVPGAAEVARLSAALPSAEAWVFHRDQAQD
jgi:hypothetical protein